MIGLGAIGSLASAGTAAATGGASTVVTGFVRVAAALARPLIGIIRGCGDTCRQASAYADQAETTLKAINAEYFGNTNRCASDRQAALDFIDGVFQWLHQGCSAVGGAAGQRCIEERLVRGGRAPWCPTGTGCDWYTLYRDRIDADRPASCGILSGTGGGGLGSLLGDNGGGDSGGMGLLMIVVVVALVIWKKG